MSGTTKQLINSIPCTITRRALSQLFEDSPDESAYPYYIGSAFTTGLTIAADGTTGISITSAFTGTNMISLAGSASGSGVAISGACATPINVTGAFTTGITLAADGTTGISITSAFSGTNAISLAGTASTSAINISGNHTIGIVVGAQTTSGIAITGATATGIAITGACSANAIRIGSSGSPAGDFTWYGTTASYAVTFDADGDTNGSVLVGADTKGLMFKLFGDITGCGVFWDPSTDTNGTLAIGASGGSKGNDVVMYGATNGSYAMWDQSANALLLAGDARVDLSSCTLAAANTDGGVIKCGTSGAPVTEDTANMKFMSFYFDDGALSGEAVGQYLRLYVTGAGGEGIGGRFYTSVTDVAAGNARGAHISLSFGATGSVTGLGTALETTLHIPSGGGLAGTVSSMKAAINSDGAASDPVGARLSVFNVVSQGDATGMADVDTDAALFDFQGWTLANGNMIAVASTPGAMPNATHSFKCRLPDGSLVYLYGGATPVTT